ncbi:MAG: exodeoxyribonuclease VII large subunit, partial [Clostridia bacterium]|nr:exodeoxyribonuclease VII large subunit [Clostridia bacterium]
WCCDNAAADVIIIGRGGGSLEDLWAFNDEALVRTVAASTIPVISAVGHETDFTLCDFAADKRAPTPSAAAELAVPDTSELKQKFANVTARLELIENNRLRSYRDNLARLASSRALVSPQNAIDDRRMALAVTETRLYDKVENIIQRKKSLMASATAKLDALNPLSVISRGYSAVFSGDGKLIKSVSQVKFGDTVSFKVTDGTVSATVTDTAEE